MADVVASANFDEALIRFSPFQMWRELKFATESNATRLRPLSALSRPR